MKDLARRFWAKVHRGEPDACWLWLGAKGPKGYGHFGVAGETKGSHCVAYSLTKGEVPVGVKVRHTCDVTSCCNPRHLVLGTAAQNSNDMVVRGRSTAGEKHKLAKLTSDAVEAVRARVASGEMQKDIATELGMSKAQISRIVNRRRWAAEVVK